MSAYVLRFIQYLDLMLLFGLLLFAWRHAHRPDSSGDLLPLPKRALCRALSVGAALGVALAGVDILLKVTDIMGVPLRELDLASLIWYAFETSAGRAGLLRISLLTVLAVFLSRYSRTGDRPHFYRLACVLAGVALVTLAWNGHAAAGEGVTGAMRLAAGIAHLLAAGAWIGAIAAFLLILARRSTLANICHLRLLWRSLHAFARTGTVLVGVLVVTGAFHYGDLTGWSTAFLFHSEHGRLLVFKLVLFIAMLSLAALHRWRLVPRLGKDIETSDASHAVRSLRLSVGLEAAVFILIVVSVAVLGTLSPHG